MRSWRTKFHLVAPFARRAILSVLIIFASSVSVAATSPIKSINVVYDGETYVLNASIYAPVSQAQAWKVLTDFDHMAQWVPTLTESRVLKHAGTTLTVQQTGVAKLALGNFPYATEQMVTLKAPISIKTTELKGNTRRLESLLLLERRGKFTYLNYHLVVVPGALAGTAMSKELLEQQVVAQFEAIVAEMERRAH